MLAYFLIKSKNYPTTSSGVPRGVTRWGDGGPLQAVAAPLTPRPRGTNYEALPFILEQDREGVPMQGWDPEKDMIHASRAAENHP